eukprot:TRINITY_DN7758_c2_g2_i1.p1 TRINITY_DN7758_c2_g2~~TRINITY_DN7758_c2_g2_i1.p1  ORF type:complete len:186 (-),score=58.25 TRINITY_DN7758_c2_g2_i1:41-598(-)
MYQVGRMIALKWKAGTNFSFAMMKMEVEERRMAFEIDQQLVDEDNREFLERQALLEEETDDDDDDDDDDAVHVRRKTKSMNASTRVSIPSQESQSVAGSLYNIIPKKIGGRWGKGGKGGGGRGNDSVVHWSSLGANSEHLREHVEQQRSKAVRHASPWPTRRHLLILLVMGRVEREKTRGGKGSD